MLNAVELKVCDVLHCIALHAILYNILWYIHTFPSFSPTAECSPSQALLQDLQHPGVCKWCDAVHIRPDKRRESVSKLEN